MTTTVNNKVMAWLLAVVLHFQPGCIVTDVWTDCNGEAQAGTVDEIENRKKEWVSPYWPNLDVICIGSPSSPAVRTRESIRFNWRREEAVHYTRLVISSEPLKADSISSAKGGESLRNPGSIVAIWNSDMGGVPGFISLDAFEGSVDARPDGQPAVFTDGSDYYWSVWGFDRFGTLGFASEERTFKLDTVESFKPGDN